MAHREQIDFCEKVKSKFPWFFRGKRILDVGSLDINGCNRYLFEECDYVGLDIGDGPNVDVVCVAHEYDEPDGSFDVVVSTNAFEHDMYFSRTLPNMLRLLKHGGLMFWTCKTTGCREHGTRRSEPSSSPLTSGKGGKWSDFYQNVDEALVRKVIDVDGEFSSYNFSFNRSGDLCFFGIRQSKSETNCETGLMELLQPLMSLSKDELRDRSVMCRTIAELGLNGEFIADWPSCLNPYLGRGLQIWQYPIQFADYLVFLSRFEVKSYLEIGARYGGTMVLVVAYLSRFSPLTEALGIDILKSCPMVEWYRQYNPICRFEKVSSQSERFSLFLRNHHFDLVMIDGLHSVPAMLNDFDNAVSSGARFIACHNIWNCAMTDECCKGWNRIKRMYNPSHYFIEFVGQYDEMKGRANYPNLGLGLAVRSDAVPVGVSGNLPP